MKIHLTTAGKEHLAQCLAVPERKTNFVKIAYGNGENAGEDAVRLSNQVVEMPLTDIKRINNEFVEITSLLNNADPEKVPSSFRATELGVFIEDPEDENETILFGYGYEPPEEAVFIKAVTNHAFTTTEKVMVYVGENENVTAIINDDGTAEIVQALTDHVEDKDNPHEVTKNQVGLGLVPNVTTNDQTPTFVEAEKDEELKSGEKLTILFGKLAKIVKTVIAHISDKKNPHGITADSIGAAEKKHLHSAKDITTGVLDVERGGTGVSSYGHLITKIGPVMGTYKGNANRLNLVGGNQFVKLGFTPAAVIVGTAVGFELDGAGNGTRGGIALKNHNLITERLYTDYVIESNQNEAYNRCMREWDDKYVAMQIEENGFRVNSTGIAGYCELNNKNETYYYIAFRQGE